MTDERLDGFLKFIEEDNTAFLDRCLNDLTDEELTRFLDDNPEFLEELVSE